MLKVLPLLLLLLLPATAKASGEIASAELELSPRGGETFYSNAWRAANWELRTGLSAPNPPNLTITPTQRITLYLPGASNLRFSPQAAVCPDSMVGPSVNISVPVPTIVARCPEAVLGNGSATFLLVGNNYPENPSTQLRGQVIAFNGGLVAGRPKIKFYAFSYDTGVGIYAEGILSENGIMAINLPPLTLDSAVNSLEFSIPSTTKSIFLPGQGFSITLPAGKNPNYVQAKCTGSQFPFSASFLLGKRLSDGTPTEPTQELAGVGESVPCQGTLASAMLRKPIIRGSSRARSGKATKYRITVRNQGGLAARNVLVSLSGKGVQGSSARIAQIPSLGSRTVTLRATFSRGQRKLRATASLPGQRATTLLRVSVR